jgi:FkbM family methyltransferase
MNFRFKRIIKRLFPRQLALLNHALFDLNNRRGIASFGQEGEDRVLASLLFKVHGARLPDEGFYVDVGAHDPFRFSNTYFFYKRGWSGINIDAAPNSMRRFAKHRPRDLNLELGVGRARASAPFYVFNEPALNTFDLELAKSRCIGSWKITREVSVDILPLRDIFSRYMTKGRRIDFITIDVEGRDMDVLDSNDWLAYRPMVVAIEILGKSIADAARDPVANFLADQNYVFYAKTVNTAFFVDTAIRSEVAA